MKNKKKTLINIIFLLLCFSATMYYVFHDQDFSDIMAYMKEADSRYWAGGVVLVVAFILSESVIIYYLMRSLSQKPKMSHCFLYSFVGFFFSLVTPSATGGQPAQILFMKKDKLPIHMSTMVLLVVTITYKLVLVIFGIVVMILRPPVEMQFLKPAMPWVYLGVALNVICVGGMLVLVFCPKMTKRMVMAIFRWFKKICRSPKVSALEGRLEHSMDGYHEASLYFQTHKGVMVNVLLLTIVQRCCLFYITYLVLLSFGIGRIGMVEVVVLQAMISVAVDMLPLPGGMGISEHLFQIIFLPICGVLLTTPAMIVSRGISYYTQLIISAAFTAIAYLMIFRGKDNDRIL